MTLCSRRFISLAAGVVLALAPTDVSLARAQDAPDPKRIAIHDDLRYRSGESRGWLLDLAMPENFGPELRPALVIVHGGGWSGGSRKSRPYRRLLTEYAGRGYVAISIDYRLLGEAAMPEIVEDVHCAVRWLKTHAAEYRVDPARIGVYGHSAGAHLALMLGVAPPGPPLEGDCEWTQVSSEVAAIAGGSTPTVLPGRFGDSARYSPATYISGGMPPLLLIHGTADPIVPVGPVEDYVTKMQAAGADVTYLRIEGGDHDVAYDDSVERFLEEMERFFERTLQQ